MSLCRGLPGVRLLAEPAWREPDRLPWSAGGQAKTRLVTRETESVKPSTRRSGSTGRTVAEEPIVNIVASEGAPIHPTSSPPRPPTAPKRKLSVKSCRTRRPSMSPAPAESQTPVGATLPATTVESPR